MIRSFILWAFIKYFGYQSHSPALVPMEVITMHKRQTKLDQMYVKRTEILNKLRSKPVIIHIKENNWQDAIPESYKDMKDLQAQITTLNA